MKARLVHYWGGPLTAEHISSVGNPMVWWFAVFCLFVFGVGVASSFVYYVGWVRRSQAVALTDPMPSLGVALARVFCKRALLGGVLLVGYLGNWVPFVLIKRVCFNYHYLPALLTGIHMSAFLADIFLRALWRHRGLRGQVVGYAVLGVLGLVMLWSFLHFSPWTYGTTQTITQQRSRLWMKEWYPELNE
jgi:dolichyl-phosphate-mannose--protein O-mannosyl transferase